MSITTLRRYACQPMKAIDILNYFLISIILNSKSMEQTKEMQESILQGDILQNEAKINEASMKSTINAVVAVKWMADNHPELLKALPFEPTELCGEVMTAHDAIKVAKAKIASLEDVDDTLTEEE